MMRIRRREELIRWIREIEHMGWVLSVRPRNAGGVGNTLEGLLGLSESNLDIADTAQWEIKTHRSGSSSLLTLLHMEPEPRGQHIVPTVLLPKYGWPSVGFPGEMSFRQTLNAVTRTDRGFGIAVDRRENILKVSFDHLAVQAHHQAWLRAVQTRVGLRELNPQPYWSLQGLYLKGSTKLLNTFYVEAQAKRQGGQEFFHYFRLTVLQNFDIDRFTAAIEDGDVLVDFDARTTHNHGTKFRLREPSLSGLYRYVDRVMDSPLL